MPASMMIAVVAGWPKVIGSRSEMVATGPIPGSTPIAVPINAPNSAKSMFVKLRATLKPSARFSRKDVSMVRQVPLPAPEGPSSSELRPHIHADVEAVDEHPPAQGEQEDGQAQDADRPPPVLRLRRGRDEDRGDERDHQ